LARYEELRRARLPPRLSQRSSSYVKEAVHTYLFGFDAACVAFCGAAVEQQVKDACVRAALYTEYTMRRAEKGGRGGMTFLEEANRGGLITETYEVAREILRRRNTVLHRGMDTDEQLSEEAARTLLGMSKVFHELDATPAK
jgi:hypothetical protein